MCFSPSTVCAHASHFTTHHHPTSNTLFRLSCNQVMSVVADACSGSQNRVKVKQQFKVIQLCITFNKILATTSTTPQLPSRHTCGMNLKNPTSPLVLELSHSQGFLENLTSDL